MVDLKFTDLLGTWQHMSLPLSAIDEAAFEEGLGFDGSSIRGWKGIPESDMLLMPDPSTAMLDPFTEVTTVSLLCGILDPMSREPYDRDPRLIAKRAEAYLTETGIADTAYFGPEAEFFVFDDVTLRPEREPCVLRGRLRGGLLELGSAGPRLHDPREARVFPRRPPMTRCTTCGPRWCSRWSGSASPASTTTTRWRRPANARSTCVSRPSRAWPIS